MKKIFPWLVALGGLIPVAHGQYMVSGKVLDKQTHQPVPYASVVLAGSHTGTTSNADGEFVLSLRQVPAKLLAFSLGYGRDSVLVTAAGSLPALALTPVAIELPAVAQASYAAGLLASAHQQLLRTQEQASYGQAFYRQLTRNGGEPSELLEAVWDVKTSSAGLGGSRLAQGRYAGRPALMNFNNFSTYTKVFARLSALVAADTTVSHAVLCATPDQFYTLRIKGLVSSGSQQIAEVAFVSRPGIPAVSGSVFIDVATYQVVHVQATRPMKMSSNKKSFVFKDGTVRVEADFKGQPAGAVPNYVKISASLVVSQPRKPDVPVQVESFAFFYDGQPVPTGLPYAGPDSPLSDLAAIKQKTYDPTFWRDNPVVKRTPVEEEVIRSFEGQKAFGTLLTK